MRCLSLLRNTFSTIHHIRGRTQHVKSQDVRLRGVQIKSTAEDSPNLIFFPQAFDQAESWLNFFANPNNKIVQQRNVYILYPRNFGTSDHSTHFGWEDVANDVARFMYEHKISMATLGGHGLGAKIALAAACYHHDKTTGYFSIDSSPMEQRYHQPYAELRGWVDYLRQANINRGFNSINHEFKSNILDPRWRTIFLNNLEKEGSGYKWKFNMESIHHNLHYNFPYSLTSWATNIGLYPGRSLFVFPEHSRYVHLGTNTNPMYSACPSLKGFNEDIFSIQGDENPLNHWVYERPDEVNPFAYRVADFLRHYDGVHVLLKNRAEVGEVFIPDANNSRAPRQDFASDRTPPHYYHNWRFNNVYQK